MQLKMSLRACVLLCVLVCVRARAVEEPDAPCRDTFLYFAYGSNLLRDRILIKNPTASFVGIGALPSYRLDFQEVNSTLWNGAVATIVQDDSSLVHGALWRLNCSDMTSLDSQEGVPLDWYYAKQVEVTARWGSRHLARTYIQTKVPPTLVLESPVPDNRRPSIEYLRVIILGAWRCGLPNHYIRYLQSIPHNLRHASKTILNKLHDLETVPLYPQPYLPYDLD